jgi:glutathione S-transferase
MYKPEAERNTQRIAELRDKTVRVGQMLSELLGEKPFFAEELSLADIQLYAASSKTLSHGAFGDAPKNLVAWCDRMGARVPRSKQHAKNTYITAADPPPDAAPGATAPQHQARDRRPVDNSDDCGIIG